MLGATIYRVLVEDLHMDAGHAGRITGMLLQLENRELLRTLAAQQVLRERVEEAAAALAEDYQVYDIEGNLQTEEAQAVTTTEPYNSGPPQFAPAPLHTGEQICPT